MKQHPFTFQQTGNEYCLTALHHLSVEEYAKYINLDHKLITTSAHQGLTWLLLSDHPLISWPLSLPQIRSQIQRFFGSFFNWIRQLMHKCGGKDVYFNDGSIIKGAFEGFPRRRIWKVGTHGMRCCFSNISYIIYYTNILHRTIVHRKLAPEEALCTKFRRLFVSLCASFSLHPLISWPLSLP